MKIRKSQGFTLVEMLVVIAIIAVLAAALFPKINSAMQSARATAMKQMGRGVWVAITLGGNEREVRYLTSLFPYDMNKEADAADGDKNLKITSAADYFNYLLSNGANSNADDGTLARAEKQEEQVCPDLNPNSFVAYGVKLPKPGAPLTDENVAWSVAEVGGPGGGPEDALLISRNVDIGNKYDRVEKPTGTKVAWKDIKPFGDYMAIWVSVNGGVFDARKTYMSKDALFAPKVSTT